MILLYTHVRHTNYLKKKQIPNNGSFISIFKRTMWMTLWSYITVSNVSFFTHTLCLWSDSLLITLVKILALEEDNNERNRYRKKHYALSAENKTKISFYCCWVSYFDFLLLKFITYWEFILSPHPICKFNARFFSSK